MFVCDHCRKQMRIQKQINRRPIGWSTIHSSEVLGYDGPRQTAQTEEVQYELCDECTATLKEFLGGDE